MNRISFNHLIETPGSVRGKKSGELTGRKLLRESEVNLNQTQGFWRCPELVFQLHMLFRSMLWCGLSCFGQICVQEERVELTWKLEVGERDLFLL